MPFSCGLPIYRSKPGDKKPKGIGDIAMVRSCIFVPRKPGCGMAKDTVGSWLVLFDGGVDSVEAGGQPSFMTSL